MKTDIHPTYYPTAKVSCACGNTFVTGSTKQSLSASICDKCHPFYTGQEKIVDTRGRVEKFKKRLEKGIAVKAGAKTVKKIAKTRKK